MTYTAPSCEQTPATPVAASPVAPRSWAFTRRYARLADANVPPERELSTRERAELSAWRDASRRRAWLVGRRLAKNLVIERLDRQAGQAPAAVEIEILSRDAQGRVNRPCVYVGGAALDYCLSISHSARGVLVALASGTGISLGVDLVEPRAFSPAFVELWFTPAERAWFRAAAGDATGQFIWAAKEALYKACNRGESFAPRDFEVLADGRYSYRRAPLTACQLRSWRLDGQLAVAACCVRPFTHS